MKMFLSKDMQKDTFFIKNFLQSLPKKKDIRNSKIHIPNS